MADLLVAAFLGLVALAPVGYLSIMAAAVKRNDNKQLVSSGAH